MRNIWKRMQLDDSGRMAFVAVVAIGFVVGAITSDNVGSINIIIALILTAIYLYLGLHDEAFIARYPSRFGLAIYFILIIALALTAQFILGPGGSWLISLPIAALAVEHLSSWRRWVVYLAILAGFALPLVSITGWQQAFFFALTFSPAIVFVVVMTESVLAENKAREEAEALADQLEQANRQLANYATQAEELATIQERNRLAREIHDNLGHYLTVVNVQIRAAQAVMTADPQKAQDALDKAQTLTQEGLAAIRQSVATLRESPMGQRPLPEAIKELVTETQNTGLVVVYNVQGQYLALDPQSELTLYRAVQEGMTNVRKHAHASRLDLTLDYSKAACVSLLVSDNGVGATAVDESGFGLLGIRERVHLLNGTTEFSTASGKGFTLTVTIPRKNA